MITPWVWHGGNGNALHLAEFVEIDEGLEFDFESFLFFSGEPMFFISCCFRGTHHSSGIPKVEERIFV